MTEKTIALISGGIDSPLSALIAAKKFEIIPLHYCLYPMTSEESAIAAFEALKNLHNKTDIEKTIIFPWTGILQKIRKKVKKYLTCVACRKSMLITAEKIGEKENIHGIITGESLGQKASQTLKNIRATSHQIKMPILRPLIGMDKEEIKKLAKEKGVFMENHAGCCLMTPDKPSTKADYDELGVELKKIDILECIDDYSDLTLELKEFDKSDFESYLFELAAEFG